jgi:hypothetical protein
MYLCQTISVSFSCVFANVYGNERTYNVSDENLMKLKKITLPGQGMYRSDDEGKA